MQSKIYISQFYNKNELVVMKISCVRSYKTYEHYNIPKLSNINQGI